MTDFQTFYGKKKVCSERFEPGTSETEPGQEVSIHTVYERCLRGEMVPNSGTAFYEKEIGVLEHPDSDLADVATLTDILTANAQSGKPDTSASTSVDPSISKASGPSEEEGAATSATDS